MAERAGNAGNARGGRHKKSPRGGAPVKARAAGKSQALRRERRLANPRVRSALAHAAAERARVEALIDKTPAPVVLRQVEVTVQRVQGGKGDPVPVLVERHVPLVDLDSKAEGDKGWSLGQARLLFGDGYSLACVVARTGWGGWWFRDMLAEDGYARTLPVLREAA